MYTIVVKIHDPHGEDARWCEISHEHHEPRFGTRRIFKGTEKEWGKSV